MSNISEMVKETMFDYLFGGQIGNKRLTQRPLP